MKSWKCLIGYLKKDFSLTKKDLLRFSIIFTFLTVLYYIGINLFNKYLSSSSILLIPFFLFVLIYGIAIMIIQYYFQRDYSKKVCVPANINKISSVILRTIKIYVIQFLIYMGFVLLFVLVSIILNFIIKPQGKIVSLFIPIGTICLIVFGVIWFYRLLFTSYILFYSRINMKSKVVIQESTYLVKKYIGVILTIVVVCIAIMIPQIIMMLKNNGHQSINFLTSFAYILIGIFNSYFFIIVTGNTIIDHKYIFLLEPKESGASGFCVEKRDL